MPAQPPRRAPGLYVTELDSFPTSVVGVPTAVPAFIGYTKKATVDGKPVLNRSQRIASLAEYTEVFGTGCLPEYDIVQVTDAAEITADKYDFRVLDSETDTELYYELTPVSRSRFHLYDSLKLFYDNGGGECFVVSVGTYRDADGQRVPVQADELQKGLDAIAEQQGATLLVVPDAVLLPPDDDSKPFVSSGFRQIVDSMLEQCEELGDRVAILDVYGTEHVTQSNLEDVIGQFREAVGGRTETLSYGMAYFPFLDTSVVTRDEIAFDAIADGSLATLRKVLTCQNLDLYSGDAEKLKAIQAEIDAIAPGLPSERVTRLDQDLSAALPVLGDIEKAIVHDLARLPPSGAMAGVYTYVDQNRGVWNGPANLSLASVSEPTFRIDSHTQQDLNVPVGGKAINALRELTGRGTIVLGARTLDGNSNDYRYIQVRRTLIYIEQSIKQALDPFVFAANDGKTWVTVVSMISVFLQDLWSKGGLMGATASEAYSVECGLGSTMTAQDILDGYMVVQVTLQMIRPAEFIELTFRQKMEGA